MLSTFFIPRESVCHSIIYHPIPPLTTFVIIVHRDIKDENVILGPGGRCLLIDFGSSGLIKKNGWDTFSGTCVTFYVESTLNFTDTNSISLDYAGPEILRGER